MTSSRNYGGRGAWFFILPLFLLMTAGTFYFALRYQSSDRQRVTLLHQEELHAQEIQSLRGQVDKLQSELSEVGSIAQQKEDQLRQKEATLESVKSANQQRETAEQVIAQKRESILLEYQKKLIVKLKSAIDAKQLSLRRDQEKLIVTLPNSVIFEAGSEAIKEEASPLFVLIGSYFQELPAEVEARIISHHDNTPLQGSLAQKYPTILELTVGRATAVAKEFIKGSNLSPKRVLSTGMGDTQPLFPNEEAQKKVQNRRIEIIFDLAPSFQPKNGS